MVMKDSHSAIHQAVIFPFMAQGHTLPLLDLSKALACRGLKVTIITTPSNAPFIRSKLSPHLISPISLSIIPFPQVKYLPKGCENVSSLPSPDLMFPFVTATRMLQQAFEEILKDMCEGGNRPICVISDFFLSWTLDSCLSFGIPRVVFHGMGALPMTILKKMTTHAPYFMSLGLSDSDPIQFPSLSVPFPLAKSDFTDGVWNPDPNDEFPSFISDIEEADANSWGVVVNSFQELEGQYVPALESLLHQDRAKAWSVGPLLLLHHDQTEEKKGDLVNSSPYTKWLNQQAAPGGSVIYVAFGSQAHFSGNQMDEIAYGLEMAGEPFIWVIKSESWFPPSGWEERVKERGLVLRDWVDQRSILAHPAIGGFLSHCGWNSVLESLSMGVPLLTWPNGAEQPVNAKYVALGLRAGVMIPHQCYGEGRTKTVDRDVVCDGVKELMKGDQGRKARERAKEIGVIARQAVENGGSSDKKLDEMIHCLLLEQQRVSLRTDLQVIPKVQPCIQSVES